MYQPSAGSILIDGVELGDVSTGQWRSLTSATFQDFVKFEFLLRESVGVGQLDFVDETAAVLGALQRGEASELAQIRSTGLETQLGRNFADGIELSGGQWQKIAVSRSMMRESPLLLVLDEPAASLDATTEAALFEHLTGAARRASRNAGAVSLFVSHRFGTARNADLIVVLNQGRVVETGNHATLMGNGGYYAELFQLQARSYQ
jgi:ATP-binding cassette subfamily B protein